MIIETILPRALALAERGRVPDILIRWGIRRLCRERYGRPVGEVECEIAARAHLPDALEERDAVPEVTGAVRVEAEVHDVPTVG